MSFFSSLIPPSRKGERNFQRARDAELRGDYAAAEEYFRTAADAFDANFVKLEKTGRPARPSHLTMAGICYTRLGRNADAMTVLDRALDARDIPDAFLNAGYAAAKSGDMARAAAYWSRYPDWADQPILSSVLREQAAALGEPDADPEVACLAVARAVRRQDKENAKRKFMTRGTKEVPAHKGY